MDTTKVQYHIEREERDGWAWIDNLRYTSPNDFFNLGFHRAHAARMAGDDDCAYRVVDESGRVDSEFHSPYERVTVNVLDSSGVWLSDIRDDYGIDKQAFLTAVKNWLEAQS